MKKGFRLLLFVLLVCLATHAWSSITVRNEITGIKGTALDNVKQRLSLAEQALGKTPSETQIISLFKQAPQQIRTALQPFGYFKVAIRSHMQKQNNQYLFHYDIQPGPALRIQKLQLRITGAGKHNPTLLRLKKRIPLKPGAILLTKSYEEIKKSLLNNAHSQGYINARWKTSQIRIDLKRYQASIELHLKTGPRFYFGTIRFNKTPLSQDLLKQFVPFKTGEPYSAEKILDLQDALNHSDYFDHIGVQAQKSKLIRHRINIQVTLGMKKRQAYTIGLGYGTDTKFRGTLGIDWRYINQYGHRFQAYAKGSVIKSTINARYTIPGPNPLTDQYSFTASIFTHNTDSADGRASQLTAAYISTKNEWQRQYALNALYSKNINNNEPTTFTSLIYPSLHWRKVHADDHLTTTSGYRLDILVLGAIENFASEVSFFQAQINGKVVRPINKDSRILIRGSLGYNSTTSTKLPVSLRLFAGGTDSIRGYDFESLPNSGVARYLFTGSLELQQRIRGDWFAAVFYDFGNAVRDFPIKIKRGLGIGIVRATPIGGIHIGVAKAFDEPGTPVRFVFSVGPDL